MEEQIQKRLRNAKTELEKGREPGLFDYMLVNDDFNTCYENLKVIPCSTCLPEYLVSTIK